MIPSHRNYLSDAYLVIPAQHTAHIHYCEIPRWHVTILIFTITVTAELRRSDVPVWLISSHDSGRYAEFIVCEMSVCDSYSTGVLNSHFYKFHSEENDDLTVNLTNAPWKLLKLYWMCNPVNKECGNCV